MNYVESALAVSQARVGIVPDRQGSHADFIQALRILGADFSTPLDAANDDQSCRINIQALFFVCSRETWEQVFGALHDVEDHSISGMDGSIRAWKCQCVDGWILCMGHLRLHAVHEPLVVLARICWGLVETELNELCGLWASTRC